MYGGLPWQFCNFTCEITNKRWNFAPKLRSNSRILKNYTPWRALLYFFFSPEKLARLFLMRNYFFCLRWNFAPNFRSNSSPMIERFSFECRKVIGFALSTRCDWLKRFAPPFHPIRSKTKANCDALACIFPRFASATCNYFEFWLVQCIVCVLCDWPE